MFAALRRNNGRGVSAATAREYNEFLVSGLQRIADAGLAVREGDGLRATRRADLVERARELMLEHVTDNLTVDEIAATLGVSRRVLRYAFQDAMGVSPYRYFLTERLHATRRMLKTGNVSVTEACIGHGFSTPSRFASQYRRLFGELPSETAAALKAGARR